MDSVPVPAGSIVVGVDGSPASDAALTWAAGQAALEQRQLTIVHSVQRIVYPSAGAVVGSTGPDLVRLLDSAQEAAHALLTSAGELALDRHPQLTVQLLLEHTDPRSILLGLAQRAAMIVVGSRGRGPIPSLLLGSVSVSVSKHAACPVVVLRPTPPDAPRSGILVGVDGTERSLPAVDFAFRIASWRGLPLTVLHCYWESTPLAPALGTGDEAGMEALVSESLAGVQMDHPEVDVRIRLARGFADQHLIAASRDHDLVVVGHHPIPLLTDIVYGSVAPQVVEHAHGAVAVVPSLGQASGAQEG